MIDLDPIYMMSPRRREARPLAERIASNAAAGSRNNPTSRRQRRRDQDQRGSAGRGAAHHGSGGQRRAAGGAAADGVAVEGAAADGAAADGAAAEALRGSAQSGAAGRAAAETAPAEGQRGEAGGCLSPTQPDSPGDSAGDRAASVDPRSAAQFPEAHACDLSQTSWSASLGSTGEVRVFRWNTAALTTSFGNYRIAALVLAGPGRQRAVECRRRSYLNLDLQGQTSGVGAS